MRRIARVPIARCFHSRKAVFNYCIRKIVARLRPRWTGSTPSLKRSVRRLLRPYRKNMGLLGRVLQTLHATAVASLLLAAVCAQSARAHERAPAFALQATPSGLSGVGLWSTPALGDLDGDGDLIAVPISKNGSPTSFALNLNATEDLDHTLTWSVWLAGGNGIALASGSGTPKAIAYTPDLDFTGTDVFIVEVANEHGTVDSATIVVRVYDPQNAVPLRDNFVALDGDGSNGLTLTEAQAQIPSLTQLEFDTVDTNGDGELSLQELTDATVGTAPFTPVYVNFSNTDSEDGATPATGFDTLLEGATFVTSGGTVIISSGSSAETIFIPKAMTLQSGGGKVTLGQTP